MQGDNRSSSIVKVAEVKAQVKPTRHYRRCISRGIPHDDSSLHAVELNETFICFQSSPRPTSDEVDKVIKLYASSAQCLPILGDISALMPTIERRYSTKVHFL